MKIFISADIEGVNGILDWQETDLSSSRYQVMREEMTKEVIAACEACKDSGVDEIYIKDAHDSAANLNIEKLPPYVKLIRGWSGHPFEMMQEINDTFDGALLIGYHSKSQSAGNPLSHTKTNTILNHIKINGEVMSEFMINSFTAAYVNVPVIFLAGDNFICEEVKSYNEKIEVVKTNEGIGRSIICRHPSIVLQEIQDGVKKAISNINQFDVKLPSEFEVEICFRNAHKAYQASYYPGVKKISDDTILYKSNDYFEVLRMMMFVI